jgi:hypothetical protein
LLAGRLAHLEWLLRHGQTEEVVDDVGVDATAARQKKKEKNKKKRNRKRTRNKKKEKKKKKGIKKKKGKRKKKRKRRRKTKTHGRRGQAVMSRSGGSQCSGETLFGLAQ